MILGLTGGIGMGKSTAARCFAERGWTVIDSDAWVRERVLTQPDVIAAVRAKFGDQVLFTTGQIDRAALARIVFADDAARLWLEDCVHPRLFALWRAALETDPGGRWILDVPLLFEKGLEIWFDFTICVATTSALQLARLAERGMSPALAEQRISKQLPLAKKIELADYVLLNDGSRAFLHEQVNRLLLALPAHS